ncbi:MAG TPA: hypothetical protein VKY65_22420 [Alphaproteobacteria bacterium]|nr:hypothetical protein [Alphaproteobacteria bacterium]
MRHPEWPNRAGLYSLLPDLSLTEINATGGIRHKLVVFLTISRAAMAERQTPFQGSIKGVKSPRYLFGFALLVAEQSRRRYQTLAEILEAHLNEPAADVFLRLAAEEETVAASLRTLARSASIEPVDPEGFDWVSRQGLPEEALAETRGPWLMTPYDVYALAIRKQERFFDNLTEQAAELVDSDARMWAERFARSAFERLVRLRLLRRRAYREGAAGRRPILIISSLADFRRAAYAIEMESSRQAELLAARLERQADAATLALFRHIAAEAKARAALLVETAGAAPGIHPIWWFAASAEVIEGDTIAALRLALLQAEERFEAYSSIATHTVDESVMAEAQTFAENSLQALSALGNRLVAFVPWPPRER